jgi:hypothetical protein
MCSLVLLTLLMLVLLLERLLPLEQHVVSQLYFLLAFIIVLQVCVLLALKSPQELKVLFLQCPIRAQVSFEVYHSLGSLGPALAYSLMALLNNTAVHHRIRRIDVEDVIGLPSKCQFAHWPQFHTEVEFIFVYLRQCQLLDLLW